MRPRLSDSSAVKWMRLLYCQGRKMLQDEFPEVMQRLVPLATKKARWTNGSVGLLKQSSAYTSAFARAWHVSCMNAETSGIEPAGRKGCTLAALQYREHILQMVLANEVQMKITM